MSRGAYRQRRIIISDSEESDDGQATPDRPTKTPTVALEPKPLSPCSPGRSVPRMTFEPRSQPLTPRRTVAFAPTPIKSISFTGTRSKLKTSTPGHKMKGLIFFDETAKTSDQQDVAVDSLDLGSLVLSDPDASALTEDIENEDSFHTAVSEPENDDDVARFHGVSSISPALSPQSDIKVLHSGHGSLSASPQHASPISLISSPLPQASPLPTSSPIPISAYDPSSPCLLDVHACEVVNDSDSDSDIAWLPTPRRQGPVQRRKIVLSDSESELEVFSSAGPSRPRARAPVDLSANSEDEAVESDGSERSGTPDSEGEGDTIGEEDEGGYQYDEDDSYGSLRDFIVDDDEETEYTTSEDEDAEEEEKAETRREGGEERERRVVSDEDEDEDDSIEVLHYSPGRRTLALPDISGLVIASSESSESESESEPDILRAKRDKYGIKARGAATPQRKRDWAKERARIASEIFDDLDKRVFENRLGSASGGVGARIEWNKRLLKTAGMARSKRTRKPDGTSDKDFWIELSEKVLTGKEQIINTVAHEMCHLATWIISNEFKNPHGRVFKSWGRKVMRARKDIEVTTTHAYVIEYKYKWKCSTDRCGKVYQRHSKSIDVAKHACGGCRGKLVPLFETRQTTSSAFQLYLKANMALAKAAMPGVSHGEVMRALSRRWTESTKSTAAEHESFWKEMAAAAKS